MQYKLTHAAENRVWEPCCDEQALPISSARTQKLNSYEQRCCHQSPCLASFPRASREYMESPGAYSFQQGFCQRTVSPQPRKRHFSILGWPLVNAKKSQVLSKQAQRAGGRSWRLRQNLGRLGHTLLSHRLSCSMDVDGFPPPQGRGRAKFSTFHVA